MKLDKDWTYGGHTDTKVVKYALVFLGESQMCFHSLHQWLLQDWHEWSSWSWAPSPTKCYLVLCSHKVAHDFFPLLFGLFLLASLWNFMINVTVLTHAVSPFLFATITSKVHLLLIICCFRLHYILAVWHEMNHPSSLIISIFMWLVRFIIRS